MLSNVHTATLVGIDAHLVRVEVDLGLGLPNFVTVGLPEGAVREAKSRVQSAVQNSGFEFPMRRIVVNLAPAELPKTNSAFDLPIAVGILTASGQVRDDTVGDFLFAGELALSGEVKPIRGILPLAIAARQTGKKGIVVPWDNAREAAVVEGLQVHAVRHFSEVADFINGKPLPPLPPPFEEELAEKAADGIDLSDIKGQDHAKRALEIAAGGGHNMLMVGPPGSGKTMLARAFPPLLPQLGSEESLETTKIYSVLGLLPESGRLLTTRPFCAPHHTISDIGLIGGTAYPKPGIVSMAHNGVLFLDELPEFRRNALEVLRQPLEERKVTISRAQQTLTFPADFILITAMNPCPCGYLGDPNHECIDSPNEIARYRSRISGPLLDRIDLQLDVPALPYRDLRTAVRGESTATVRERIERVREVQGQRYSGVPGVTLNSRMPRNLIEVHCALDEECHRIMELAVERMGISARAHDRILKVSRTIADMDDSERIQPRHLAEAIQYRSYDRGTGG
jgi:magnesium chelatase family protein